MCCHPYQVFLIQPSVLLKVNIESSISTYFQNWLSSNMTLSSKCGWCFCSPTDPWLKGFLAVKFPLLYKNSTLSILTNLSKLFWVSWSTFLFLSAIYTNVTNLIGSLAIDTYYDCPLLCFESFSAWSRSLSNSLQIKKETWPWRGNGLELGYLISLSGSKRSSESCGWQIKFFTQWEILPKLIGECNLCLQNCFSS